MLNGLDLFSGIGGITLALQEWVRPCVYCECDRYAQGVLLSRMADGTLPRAPIWDDVLTFQGTPFRRTVDIIYGGFPCQDISCAGTGKGLEGERSGLFFQIMRLVDEIQPPFIFLENVPVINCRGLGTVAAEITKRGYDCRWTLISAAEVGANHLRKRWFLLAHAPSERLERRTMQRPREICKEAQGESGYSLSTSWQDRTNEFLRDVLGLQAGVDRIKCLGNSVVPLQAREAFKRLMGLDH